MMNGFGAIAIDTFHMLLVFESIILVVVFVKSSNVNTFFVSVL